MLFTPACHDAVAGAEEGLGRAVGWVLLGTIIQYLLS